MIDGKSIIDCRLVRQCCLLVFKITYWVQLLFSFSTKGLQKRMPTSLPRDIDMHWQWKLTSCWRFLSSYEHINLHLDVPLDTPIINQVSTYTFVLFWVHCNHRYENKSGQISWNEQWRFILIQLLFVCYFRPWSYNQRRGHCWNY